MVYDKKLLGKWLELRSDLLIKTHSRGILNSVHKDDIKKEFAIIALEMHEIFDGVYQQAVKDAESKKLQAEERLP